MDPEQRAAARRVVMGRALDRWLDSIPTIANGGKGDPEAAAEALALFQACEADRAAEQRGEGPAT